MEKTEWLNQAVDMKVNQELTWNEITSNLRHYFPADADEIGVYNTIRGAVRKTEQYKQYQSKKQQQDFERSSIEYKADGQVVSEKFITVRDGIDMTPEFILESHGLDVNKWEVVSYKNNFWNSQQEGGYKQISYQSKLTAKPKTSSVDLSSVLECFKELDRHGVIPVEYKHQDGSMMAEVNIADLHLGKLCWHGDTLENYDHKIAEEMFTRLIGEIAERLKTMPIEKILFVWSNDFFNSDNEQKTTTAGTPQDTDIRNKKMFNIGCKMLVTAIETLKHATNDEEKVIPIETFYTPSNHDEETSYHALGLVGAYFRQDANVTVDLDAYPRKYILYGNSLIGFTHGDKENDKGSKEKASRLASLMPIEAKKLWGQAQFYEMHTAHLHSEQMIQEINGVIVRRISSPTALDTYHTTYGYMGAVRKAQTFVYDKERGLMHIINTPVR